jgi:predicted hotdog family 3-hydroxylacyl-ACP dehydratase
MTTMARREAPLLDRDAIAALVPHADRMALLDRCNSWNADTLSGITSCHRDPGNPLRTASGLLAPCGIEIAAQAMALHAALAGAGGDVPRAGYLASVRDVRCLRERLDDVAGDLHVHVQRLLADRRQLQYRFRLEDETGATLLEGRAMLVLDAALAALTEAAR